MKPTRGISRIAAAAMACALAWLSPVPRLGAQAVNPVYLDDSPASSEGLARVRDHIATGNRPEAVRVLQSLLENQGDQVTAIPGDPDLFGSVRDAVHRVLLADADLLAHYRETQSVPAQRLLQDGRVAEVERTRLLTEAGYEAALRIAQQRLEDASFESARITLEQLERHPDRRGQSGVEAATLLMSTARYLDREEVWALAARWRAEAEAGAAAGNAGREPVRWPSAARSRGLTPLDRADEATLSGVVSKPLWSQPTGRAPASPDPAAMGSGDRLPLFARELFSLPAVAGDLVLLNDGQTVAAFDLFTLSPRWSLPLAGAPGGQGPEDFDGGRRVRFDGRGPSIEDASTVTVRGPWAAAITGRAAAGSRTGDPRVHLIHVETGKVRWSVDIAKLADGQLSECSLRGPAEIAEGLVLLSARKDARERRLVGLVLLALDLRTGDLVWHRTVGSAGSLPYIRQANIAEGLVESRGVVYRADRLGVAGAYEAATGRPVWVRRMPVDAMSPGETGSPWELSRPVVRGDSVILLAPDMRRIVRLDRATGAILGQRTADRVMTPSPRCLISAGRDGSRLVAIGAERVSSMDADTFDQAGSVAVLSPPMPGAGVRGRVIAAGDSLLIPTVDGLIEVSAARPDSPARLIALDEPGNAVALPSQVVVADDSRLHSYLLWDEAERRLLERMSADPRDPAPPITLAELAYRAGKPDRIIPAADAAARAIAADPISERNRTARRRLFDALHAMVVASQEAAAPPLRTGVPEPALPRLQDRALIAGLVERLGAAAESHEERVAYLIASGRAREQAGDAVGAVARYQEVLDSAELAAANWRGPQVSVRGEIEATRRIEQIIGAHGASAYAAQSARATQELTALGPAPSAEALASIVARYPLSPAAVIAGLRLAETHQHEQRPQAMISSLEGALRHARRIPGADPAVVAEIAGRLVQELASRRQYAAAARVLRETRERFTGLALTAGGVPLDADALGADLSRQLASVVRWPRVGVVREGEVQLLEGWSVLPPVIRDRTPRTPAAIAMENEARVALWAPAGPSTETLSIQWERALDGVTVDLIRLDETAAYFFFGTQNGGVVEKVPLSPSASRWRTDPFDKVAPPPGRGPGMQGALARVPGGGGDRFVTPRDGIVGVNDAVVVMDERTLVLLERSGRAAAFDTDTGETLWSSAPLVPQVYDAALASGTLVIGGAREILGAGGTVVSIEPVVLVADARTGRVSQRLGEDFGPVHFLRLTDGGDLLCAHERGVVSINLASNRTNWSIQGGASGSSLVPPQDAWVLGETLLMLGADRALYSFNTSSGRTTNLPLEVPPRYLDDGRPIDAFLISTAPQPDELGRGEVFGVATYQGLLVYGPGQDTRPLGVDALGGIDTMLPPVPAHDRAVAVQTIASSRRADGLMAFPMHEFFIPSALAADNRSVLLPARPSSVTLLDGRIAITSAGSTVILRAPAQ